MPDTQTIPEVFEVWSSVEGRVANGTDRATAFLELTRALSRAVAANRSSLFDDSCDLLVTWGQEAGPQIIRRITVRGGKVESDTISPGDWRWEYHGGPAPHAVKAVGA